jgi:ribulose 1,5-bisphosphate carboxylase large subunit-like protein
MLAKLGRETIALLNGGEVDHPGLQRGAERIRALDAQIDALGADPASE